MIKELNRRTFLGTLGTTATIALAGCGYQEPTRILTFLEVSVENHGDEWRASFDIVNTNEASDEIAAFHDVRVHGYDRNQVEVCSEHIGTVSGDRHRDNGIPIELKCLERPTAFTCSTAESLCSKEVRTTVDILIYDEEDGWLVSRTPRKCGEGLPPEPRDE